MPVCNCLPPNCSECVERYRAGDGEALSILLSRLRPKIDRIVQGVLGRDTRSELDDAEQIILIKITTRMNQWRGPEPFCFWAAAIASNTALRIRKSTHRRRKRWGTITEEDIPDRPTPIDDDDLKRCIRRVFEQLPKAKRQVFDMAAQGIERGQIAAKMGKKRRTIQNWLADIRERLSVCRQMRATGYRYRPGKK